MAGVVETPLGSKTVVFALMKVPNIHKNRILICIFENK
uniref:Uncharacterized protein n=1 Tax=Nelumbo nucifera TaxID=4432 RepID=A0A822Y971_NELNU|nr:TPA_asm: hypothetical protein HUJ06_027606 [Nelumbo nucifera]